MRTINGWTKEKMKAQIMERNIGKASMIHGFGCAYQGADGNACAVGCFLPKDYNLEDFESGNSGATDVLKLIERFPDLRNLMPLDVYDLKNLQVVHDSFADTPDDPRPALLKWIDENVTNGE